MSIIDKKSYFIGALGLLVGYLIGQTYSILEPEPQKTIFSEKEIEKNTNIIVNSNRKINLTNNQNTTKSNLPLIIQNELNEYEIDINNLNKKAWENFIKKKNIEYLEKLSNKTLHSNSLMHYALKEYTNLNLVKYLVDNGFDINKKNRSAQTPMMVALSNKNMHLFQIKKLIEMGAELDNQSINQALKNSDKYKKKKLLNFLKEQGYKIEGMELFMSANLKGNKEYLLELLPTIDVNENYLNNTSAFEYAMMYNQGNEVIEYFLDNNIDLKNNTDGINPLHFIRNNNISLKNYQRMIDAGANVNEQNSVGQTPLHYATISTKKRAKKVELLLKNGASASIVDKYGRNTYDYADNIKDSDEKEHIKQLLKKYDN